jgi:hypothetical protein
MSTNAAISSVVSTMVGDAEATPLGQCLWLVSLDPRFRIEAIQFRPRE